MDQRERIGNRQESLRAAIRGSLSNLRTAMPGIVQSVNLTKMTVVVQPAIKAMVRNARGIWTSTQLPLLTDVPIVFPCAGGFALTLPIAPGDEVLVIIADRCIDAWWQNGGVQNQAELRLHDLSDGFAIPGPQSVPHALGSISAANAQLRTRDGSAYIELTPAGAVNIKAPGGVHVTGVITASDEITAKGSHTVSQHVHGGVSTGTGQTGAPIG